MCLQQVDAEAHRHPFCVLPIRKGLPVRQRGGEQLHQAAHDLGVACGGEKGFMGGVRVNREGMLLVHGGRRRGISNTLILPSASPAALMMAHAPATSPL